jgi:hypothetical protein
VFFGFTNRIGEFFRSCFFVKKIPIYPPSPPAQTKTYANHCSYFECSSVLLFVLQTFIKHRNLPLQRHSFVLTSNVLMFFCSYFKPHFKHRNLLLHSHSTVIPSHWQLFFVGELNLFRYTKLLGIASPPKGGLQ